MKGSTTGRLLALSVPSIVIGVVSALLLFLIDRLAALAETAIWHSLPSALRINADSPLWIVGVLTLTGFAVGLSIWLLPGHAGRDSATTELIAAPIAASATPGLALAAVFGLAGGVSLGPENPVIAVNTALLVTLLGRFWSAMPTEIVVMVTAAATIGALFGTPVAAALLFTGVVGASSAGGALWDRLFLPLLAAGAGAVTMSLLATPTFAFEMPEYSAASLADLLSASVIASVAAALGVATCLVFRPVHSLFHRLRHPVLYVTGGGLVLGLLGALGGPVTLFKGVTQLGDLVTHRGDYALAAIVLIIAVKTVALVVAASSGFRGGRIFPAVFIGGAIGILANAVVPAVPLVVAVAAGVLGMVIAIARDGWIALFIAVAVTGSVAVLPVLCIAILPAWLIVSRAPEMIVSEQSP